MIKSILSLALLLSLSPMKKDEEVHQNFFEQRNGYTLAKTEKLGIQTLNHNLLNKIVFQLVNKKRQKKGLDSLEYTTALNKVSHAFQDKLEEFKKRNVEVIASSVDSWFSHAAWLNTPKQKGGIEGVTYPIISDFNKEISKEYGVHCEDVGASYRGLFLMDTEGVVRHQVINDLPLGRNVDEVIRMVDALQFHEKNGEVCPANWNDGEKSMTPNKEGLEQYFTQETIVAN